MRPRVETLTGLVGKRVSVPYFSASCGLVDLTFDPASFDLVEIGASRWRLDALARLAWLERALRDGSQMPEWARC